MWTVLPCPRVSLSRDCHAMTFSKRKKKDIYITLYGTNSYLSQVNIWNYTQPRNKSQLAEGEALSFLQPQPRSYTVLQWSEQECITLITLPPRFHKTEDKVCGSGSWIWMSYFSPPRIFPCQCHRQLAPTLQACTHQPVHSKSIQIAKCNCHYLTRM